VVSSDRKFRKPLLYPAELRDLPVKKLGLLSSVRPEGKFTETTRQGLTGAGRIYHALGQAATGYAKTAPADAAGFGRPQGQLDLDGMSDGC
jgi:hypothetical protein